MTGVEKLLVFFRQTRTLQSFRKAIPLNLKLSIRFLQAVSVILLSLGAGQVLAEDPPRNFYCREEDRFLTDLEFLESAFAYEVEERDLPEPYLSLGISGMKKIDPGCCNVRREDGPFYENWGWLERLLYDPPVWVIIGWDLDPNDGGSNNTNYAMSICGEVTERRGDFRQRDYNN